MVAFDAAVSAAVLDPKMRKRGLNLIWVVAVSSRSSSVTEKSATSVAIVVTPGGSGWPGLAGTAPLTQRKRVAEPVSNVYSTLTVGVATGPYSAVLFRAIF